MGLLSDKDRESIRSRLNEEMSAPAKVILFTEQAPGLVVPGSRPCASCKETEELMEELASLTDQLSLEVHDVRQDSSLAEQMGIKWLPTFTVQPEDQDAGVRFLGFPAGFEFISFIETLLSLGKPQFGLKPDSAEKLDGLDKIAEIKTFSTPT